MLPEIALEALRYFDRTELEGLEMHSRYLRDFVDRHTRSLPLRYIDYVEVAYGEIYIQLLDDGDDEFMVGGPAKRHRDVLFRRVNNAFIHRLEVSFDRDDLPRLRYLRANASRLQCRIGALRIDDTSAAIDYALVGFFGDHFKPHTYETSIESHREDYAKLFAHNALRGSVKHLVYECDDLSAAYCIIRPMFGVDVVETCAIETAVDPRPWIHRFIETFETAERGMEIVRTVSWLYKRYGDASPLSHGVEPMRQPRCTDAPTPHSRLVKEWVQDETDDGIPTNESTAASLFVFENATLAKKLDVFVWTIEQGNDEDQTVLHYSFLLKVDDM